MLTTMRAAASVVMLAGFYVVALALVAGLGVLSAIAFQANVGAAGAKLAVLAVVVAGSIVVALWKVARTKTQPQPGAVVSPADAPALWAMVRELAQTADTRVPDEIRLIAEVNAGVSEDARLLGLLAGYRRLYLGVPLMQALDVAQLRSVLAHELGHYSRSHTRVGPLTHRGRAAMHATLEQLSGTLVGWFLKQYAKLYFLVSAVVSRQQELEADELSVRVAGRAVAQGTLLELPVIDAAWSFYTSQYLSAPWEDGFAPTSAEFFGGFRRLLSARAGELATMRADAAPSEQSAWDTHPPITARVAAMERMPDGDQRGDTRPATELVPGFDALATWLADHVVSFEDRARLDWDGLTAASFRVQDQRSADVVYRAAARLTGGKPVTLATVLDLLAWGHRAELEHELGIDDGDAPGADVAADGSEPPRPPLAGALGVLIRLAAVTSGVAHWRHSWVSSADLVDRDDVVLDLDAIAVLAIDPGTVGTARARLLELGIDLGAAVQVGQTATAHGGELIGGLANAKVNGAWNDVLLLDNGLILVPCPKKTDGGKRRMAALVRSAPLLELAAQHRFVPFEEVASAAVLKATPARVDLTLRDGTVLSVKETWSGERLSKDSADTLVAIAAQFVRAQPAPVRS